MSNGFREKLKDRQESVNSLVCVGLDPLPEKLPKCLRRSFWFLKEWRKVACWMINIVDATAPYASMFKLQSAHYEAFGADGRKILQAVISFIKEFHPDIPIFLDCKRGDIGRTQERYRIAHFNVDGADGMNFNPYMGKECMSALSELHSGKGIVGICYTSNSSAREMQDIKLADGRLYWEFTAERILKWSKDLAIVGNAGLVMAAAYENPRGSGNVFSEHLKRCREIVDDELWFLIPGIGTQGGFVRETVKAAFRGPGSIAINSSSDIIFASSGPDFAEAAGRKAQELRDQIRRKY